MSCAGFVVVLGAFKKLVLFPFLLVILEYSRRNKIKSSASRIYSVVINKKEITQSS